MLPHPDVTLAVKFSDGPHVVEDAVGRQRRGSLVTGLASGAVRMGGERENIACVEVRLSPLVAHSVLGVPPVQLGASTVALDDVWGQEAGLIREQLRDATSWEDRFTLTESLLARRSGRGSHAGPEVAGAWERIVASRGRVRVGDLAAEAGWSRERLWERFRSQIGLPPKRVARLVRFHHAVRGLTSGEAAVRGAAECGYGDQSHLHQEVFAFTSTAPATLAGDAGLRRTPSRGRNTAPAGRTPRPAPRSSARAQQWPPHRDALRDPPLTTIGETGRTWGREAARVGGGRRARPPTA